MNDDFPGLGLTQQIDSPNPYSDVNSTYLGALLIRCCYRWNEVHGVVDLPHKSDSFWPLELGPPNRSSLSSSKRKWKQ